MIPGILILLLCQLAGEIIAHALNLTVPGGVLGMLILFVGLIVRGGVPASVDYASQAILKPLIVYFIPASVGVMTMWPLLKEEGIRIAIVLVFSTIIPLLLCGYGLDRWLSRKRSA